MPSIVISTLVGSCRVTPLAGTEEHPHARAVLSGEPSHAYLFTGPAGSGKEDVAREFAAALLAGPVNR
jgi:adenylylsulfate kinase-like enzyme